MNQKITNEIFSIPVPLPNNPLKELNAYLIKGADRSLLIDTGFNVPECLAAIEDGLAQAGINMEETDIFLTHLHSDHTGLAPALASESTKIYISSTDLARLNHYSGTGWDETDAAYKREGFPPELLAELVNKNPARAFAPPYYEHYTPIEAGEVLDYGGLHLEVVATPGHTPGHLCLYERERKIMFLGDHVLFDITPNITSWLGFKNTLKHYLDSLDMVEKLAVELPLPAHRSAGVSLRARIAQLKQHHEERIAEALRIVRENPGLTAYDIAGHMTWQIRSRNWADFPVAQKWFAVGEGLAHLDYLVEAGDIRRVETENAARYYPVN